MVKIDNKDNKEYISKLVEYKISENKLNDNYSEENIFFRVVEFNKLSILYQSRKLDELGKEQRKKNEQQLNRAKNLKRPIVVDDKKISIFIDKLRFKADRNHYKILYEYSSADKQKIYNICRQINKYFYEEYRDIIADKNNFYKRMYDKYIIENSSKSQNMIMILSLFEKLKNIINNVFLERNEKKKLEIYLSNLLEDELEEKFIQYRKAFKGQLLLYIRNKIELNVKDISKYFVLHLKSLNLIKRVELTPKASMETLEKSYILKNNRYNTDEKKDENVEYLIEKIDLDRDISELLELYKLDELIEKLKKERANGIDVNLFGIYKVHYQELGLDFADRKNKILYKLTYRYIKKQIDKLIYSKNFLLSVEKRLSMENLKVKIKERVQQYCLEHILYLGKLTEIKEKKNIIDDKVAVNYFYNYQLENEYTLKLISFILLGAKLLEIYRDDIDKKYQIEDKIIEIDKLLIENNEIIDIFSQEMLEKKLKGVVSKIEFENLSQAIFKDRLSYEKISKALKFDFIFNNPKKRDLFIKINNLPYIEPSRKYIDYIYIFPFIKKKFENENRRFKDENLKIKTLECFYYISEILYNKLRDKIDTEEKYLKYKNSILKNKLFHRYIEDIAINYIEMVEEFDSNFFNFKYLFNRKMDEYNKYTSKKSKEFVLIEKKNPILIMNELEYIVAITTVVSFDVNELIQLKKDLLYMKLSFNIDEKYDRFVQFISELLEYYQYRNIFVYQKKCKMEKSQISIFEEIKKISLDNLSKRAIKNLVLNLILQMVRIKRDNYYFLLGIRRLKKDKELNIYLEKLIGEVKEEKIYKVLKDCLSLELKDITSYFLELLEIVNYNSEYRSRYKNNLNRKTLILYKKMNEK